jgi:O-antigen/teichoic acid export membrane protein
MLIKFSALQLLGKLIPGLIGFAAAALLTRLMPPSEFGVYGLVVALVQMIVLAGFSWLGLSVMRIASGGNEEPGLWASSMAVFLTIAIVVACAAAVFSLSPFASGYRAIIAAALLGSLVFAYLDLRSSFYAAACDFAPPMRFSIARAVFGSGAAVAVAYWGGGGLAAALASFTAALLVIFATARRRSMEGLSVDLGVMKSLYSFGLPLIVGLALVAVSTLTDRLILEYHGGKPAVGLYTAAAVLVQSTLLLAGNAIGTAGFPLAVRAYEEGGPLRADHQLRRNAVVLLAFLLPGGAALCVLAPNLARVLVGPHYREALVALTPLLAGAAVLTSIRANWLDHGFHLTRSTGKLAGIAGVMAVVNVAALLILVPAYSHIGAGAAALMTAAAGLVYGAYVAGHVYRMPFPWRELGKIVVAVAVMAAIRWPCCCRNCRNRPRV